MPGSGRGTDNVISLCGSVRSVPWLAAAAAAWLALFPCGQALAEDDLKTGEVTIDNTDGRYGTVYRRSIIGIDPAEGDVKGSATVINISVEGSVIGGKTGVGAARGCQVQVTGGDLDQSGQPTTQITDYVIAGQGTAGAFGNAAEIKNIKEYRRSDSWVGGATDAGEARGNRVTVTDSVIRSGYLYGGKTGSGKASDNLVSLTDSSAGYVYGSYTENGDAQGAVTAERTFTRYILCGGYTKEGNVADSRAETSGTHAQTPRQSNLTMYGGWVDGTGNATGNRVKITDDWVYAAYGSFTSSGTASGKVVISAGKIGDEHYFVNGRARVTGGYTGNGSADGSRVRITGISVVLNGWYSYPAVFGGRGTSGAEDNRVVLSDSRSDGVIYGGYTDSGNARQNRVRVTSESTVSGEILGGDSEAGRADDNRVTVSGSSVDGLLSQRVYGGRGAAGASSNAVTLKDGAEVSIGVLGGWSNSGEASGNRVRLLLGSSLNGDAIGGYSESGHASGNRVTVSGSSVAAFASGESTYGGNVYGGQGGAGASSNTVILKDGASVDRNVYGGYSESGAASGNLVRLSGESTAGAPVYGGYTGSGDAAGNFVYVSGSAAASGGVTGGYTVSGNASGNSVTVDGGKVLDHLYGGYTALGNAGGNTITVSGGTVNAEIIGGYDDGTATGNIVNLHDSAVLAGSEIYGGRSGGSSSDVFTGNTLNVHGQIGAASLQNFQNLNFYDVADDKASVDLSRSAMIGDGKGSMTNVSIVNFRNQEGDIPDEYVLIHTPTASSSYTGTNLYVNGNTVVTIGPDGSYVPYSGTVANDGTMDNATGSTGMTKSQTLTKGFLTFEVDYFIKNGQDLIARWKKNAPVEVNSETEEFTASRQASAALMDEGADFVAGEGIDRALQASQCLPGEPCGAKAFMAVNGGYSTYKAGTTFNISYGNMLAGIARQCKIGPVNYLAGVFFETGLGRFHSEYEPDDSRSIDSEGHDYYYGVGALAKVFLNRDLLKGLYAEGAIRYGLMMGDWQSHDIQADGQTADWDGRAPSLTAHGGLGYMWDVTDNVTADVYAKYFWGHLWGDDGTICGQKFEFDDIYSSRVRTGARLNFKKDETFSWYLGGAWERQFDSKSRGSIYGYNVPSTDLKGNTAIAEAGVFFRPAAGSDLSFMLGATGYFGEKREGVTGLIQIRYDF